MPIFLVLSWLLGAVLFVLPCGAQDEAPATKYGHSSHGAAYDEGPRQRPWKMQGIGRAPFPVTSAHPDVQQWFDQGNALLHSFWYYEAERAFRWCIKLDPDCAMAYLWLSRCVPYDKERSAEFLKQAVERMDKASERERRYIAAWEKTFVATVDDPDPARGGWNQTSEELAEELEKIILDYPEDIEAKALYVLNSMFDSGKFAIEAVLQQILEVRPDHPGAIHYRIHNWDDPDVGHVAIESCAAYGRIASRVGHANHMPGHIYTKLGMWHEGAIWLDAATRVEKGYMQTQLVLPFHNWNYAHNRNFLAHAQSMLGLPSAALQGAYDMLNAPLDPDLNKDKAGFSVFRQGIEALRRTLVRFERWDEILEPDRIPWRDSTADDLWRTYCEALAHIGTGDLDTGERLVLELRGLHAKLAGGPKTSFEQALAEAGGDMEKVRENFANKQVSDLAEIMYPEAEGRLRLARGEAVRAIELLGEAAELEFAYRAEHNDPPVYPRSLYNVLGEAYMELESPRLAVQAFEKSLKSLPNNGFSWAGLTRAHHALGDEAAAARAYARMRHSWSAVEAGVWQAERAAALGLEAAPEDISPAEQRNYATTTLADLGPNTWQPYMAPELDALTASRARVSLEDYRGKNVLLIFYLSDQCVHCVEQLHEVKKVASALKDRDTVVLAISSDPPEKNADNELADLPFAVLSDTADHANAIRFKSYDEFEDIELHSTLLIDRNGRLRWARTGGDPFMDMQFITGEIDRIEAIDAAGRLQPAGATPSERR